VKPQVMASRVASRASAAGLGNWVGGIWEIRLAAGRCGDGLGRRWLASKVGASDVAEKGTMLLYLAQGRRIVMTRSRAQGAAGRPA